MATRSKFVVIPFTKLDAGYKAAPSIACSDAEDAMMRARLIVEDDTFSGAVAMRSSGDPTFGVFKDPEILGKFGDVPEDLGER